jgi:hypothetical protein
MLEVFGTSGWMHAYVFTFPHVFRVAKNAPSGKKKRATVSVAKLAKGLTLNSPALAVLSVCPYVWGVHTRVCVCVCTYGALVVFTDFKYAHL